MATVRSGEDALTQEVDYRKYDLPGIKELWSPGVFVDSAKSTLHPTIDLSNILGGAGSQTKSVFDLVAGLDTGNNGAAGGDGVSGAPSGNTDGVGFGDLGLTGNVGLSDGVGKTGQAIGNAAISGIVGALTGVTGLGTLASLFGINVSQALSEMMGLTDTTPGFEGGLMGTPGIGEGINGGITGSAAADTGTTPDGFSPSDEGRGLAAPGPGLGLNSVDPDMGLSPDAMAQAVSEATTADSTSDAASAQGAADAAANGPSGDSGEAGGGDAGGPGGNE